jgi:hypothetical protein
MIAGSWLRGCIPVVPAWVSVCRVGGTDVTKDDARSSREGVVRCPGGRSGTLGLAVLASPVGLGLAVGVAAVGEDEAPPTALLHRPNPCSSGRSRLRKLGQCADFEPPVRRSTGRRSPGPGSRPR